MSCFKKTTLSMAALIVSSAVFAGTNLDTRVRELEKKIELLSTTTANGTYGPQTASARAEPNGMGWNLSFNVLYWQTKAAGLEYAVVDSSFGNSPVIPNGSPQEPKFGWDWGFKAAIGYNFEHDGWDSKLEYTYFRNKASGRIEPLALPSVIQSPLLMETNPLTYSSASQYTAANVVDVVALEGESYAKNNFNDLYLDLGRDFFVSKNLSMRPGFGVEATWFSLTQAIKFTGGTTTSIPVLNLEGVPYTNKTIGGLGKEELNLFGSEKFFGVGPRASLDTRWHLGEGISFYGNVKGALLFSYLKLKREGSFTGQPLNQANISAAFHRLNPAVKFELGLMYDKYIVCDTQHVSLSLGYENQYYWELLYGANAMGRGIGMYGVNLKFQWDF